MYLSIYKRQHDVIPSFCLLPLVTKHNERTKRDTRTDEILVFQKAATKLTAEMTELQ